MIVTKKGLEATLRSIAGMRAGDLEAALENAEIQIKHLEQNLETYAKFQQKLIRQVGQLLGKETKLEQYKKHQHDEAPTDNERPDSA